MDVETTKEKAQSWIQRFAREMLDLEQEQAFNGTTSPVSELLGLCGCGDPERLILIARDACDALHERSEAAIRNDSDGWDLHERRLIDLLEVPDYEQGLPQAPWARDLVMNWLDQAGLLEHGSNIRGSWLTDKGKRFLKLMQEWPGDVDDIREVVKPCNKAESSDERA